MKDTGIKGAVVRAKKADADLLTVLKAAGGDYVSGQKLSASLDVSRTAVWKRIKNLKDLGYAIDAAPRKGYRLACPSNESFNGVEVLSSLKTEFIGKNVYFYDELVSTNATAVSLAFAGAPEGTIVIAESQTGGKGRLGRRWHSPAGKNLYTSIILRPQAAPASAQGLTLAFAVATAEAIGEFTSTRPEVKWPNDILMGSRKVAGILTEMASEMDRINHVVAGIGINVNMEAASLPVDIKTKAASLREFSRTGAVSRAVLASALYSAIEKWYKIFLLDGLRPVIHAWRDYFGAEGKLIEVNAIDRIIGGVCMGIDDDGALLLREPSGKVARITSGEMAISEKGAA